MENSIRSSIFNPINVVSTELKQDRKPSFKNGDSDSTDIDMCDDRITKLAFEAAYMKTIHFTRLPTEG